jgi:hypothetical protein
MRWHEFLAAIGAVLQLAGFAWVIWTTSAAVYREYEEQKTLIDAFRTLAATFRPPEHRTVEATSSVGFATSLETNGHREGESEDQRQLRALREEFTSFREEAQTRFSSNEEGVERISQDLTAHADATKDLRRSDLRKERGGAAVFALGMESLAA